MALDSAHRDDHVEAAHYDVLIVGGGLSGVGAARHLQLRCPQKNFAILEGRDAIGGTWDLFRYPGVRSDSDMITLGYGFKPWTDDKVIADGPSILNYIKETASEYDLEKKIRFNHWVTKASWSSDDMLWTVDAKHDGAPVRFTCNFLWMCSGYYKYAHGYTPDFEGVERFRGEIIHPQHWPEDLDYAGKRVLIIGSGATAVTLAPSMAEKAGHVTMLQRSPSYVFSIPAVSPFSKWLKKFLPDSWRFHLLRFQRIVMQQFFFKYARARPEATKRGLLKLVREELGPDFDVEKHFTPTYNPWDQRLCLVPDNDLFKSIKSGRTSIVTDHIKTFTETGIELKSGDTLEADIIVTATGLILEASGGADVFVDGEKIETGDLLTYKGLMYAGVPNFVSVFGYTNASWTLRADLVSEYTCRLLNHMDEHGFAQATPINRDEGMARRPFLDFSSGYIQRANKILPKQGTRQPWLVPQSYAPDFWNLKLGRIDDGVMEFKKASGEQGAAAPAARTDAAA